MTPADVCLNPSRRDANGCQESGDHARRQAASWLGARSYLDRLLHGRSRLGCRHHGAAPHAARPPRRPRVAPVDADRVQHRFRRRHHHRSRRRRPLRPAAGLQYRPRPVHRRLGGLCARPGRPRADRRPHRAGPGRRDSPPAQPHDPDDGFPCAATRDDRRHLRRTRRAGGRAGADHRRRGHPGNRLALDLLDQRADRGRRLATRDAAAARQLRRPGAAGPARRYARDQRHRCHCLGPGPRGPGGLGERRDRQLPGWRRCPAARLRRLGTARQRTDAAPAPVPQPRVHGRQRHDLPHDGRDLRRRLPGHPGVPARPRLLTSLGRRAPAPLLRHADAHLTDRRRRLRPHRPPGRSWRPGSSC